MQPRVNTVDFKWIEKDGPKITNKYNHMDLKKKPNYSSINVIIHNAFSMWLKKENNINMLSWYDENNIVI